jgi:hypothetical protein
MGADYRDGGLREKGRGFERGGDEKMIRSRIYRLRD